MNKKNIYILIFAIIFFVGALAFLLSTISNNNVPTNNIINNSSNLLVEETDYSRVIEDYSDTSNVSNTSDSISENLPDMEYSSLIDFSYYNKDEEEFNISRYKNKPIAILFSDFSENYDTSVEYLSFLNSYYEKYKSNVQFLCIDKSTLASADSNIEVYKDNNGIEKYSIDTLPTLIFIDKEGKITNQISSITLDSLEANLDLITGNF